jgi:hypothetical protein
MELYLLNTAGGLKPLYDADYDEKKKLKIGETYKATLKVPRNLAFHRKYFALINCAWEYLTEEQQEPFANSEQFRKYLEVAAGHYDQWFSPDYGITLRIPKSIAFDKMSGDEFGELYRRIKDVLFARFLTNISEEEFCKNLINF